MRLRSGWTKHTYSEYNNVYVINDDYSIDFENGIVIKNFELEEFPYKFNNIGGDFNIGVSVNINSTKNFRNKANVIYCNAIMNLERPDWCECKEWMNNEYSKTRYTRIKKED